jgi:hypothetical protein
MEKATMKLLLVIVLVSSSLALAASHEVEYQTGKLISWGAGGENCAGLSVGRSVSVGKVNCNPGGDTLYKVSVAGHQYTLTRGTEDEGMVHDKSDPLRQLVPDAEFKFRIDLKKKYFLVPWTTDKGKTKETKYTVRGVE